jgi:pyruvate/2-oxoacid:ferredoxin oxidoreductase alpha subunit
MFGRKHGLVESYRAEDAEILLIASGTATSTAREVIDDLRGEGRRVGLLKIRLFRPFPARLIREYAARTKKLAVIDRNIGFGVGGIFAQEVKAALYDACQLPLFGFIAGLGGRDVTPATVREMLDYADSHEKSEDLIWIGLKR